MITIKHSSVVRLVLAAIAVAPASRADSKRRRRPAGTESRINRPTTYHQYTARSLGGLDALAVDDRRRGAGVAPDPFAICHHERVVYPVKAPVIAPGGEPAVNRPPWRQVLRQQAPRAACPHDIEDAVDDLAHRPLAGPARRTGLRQVRRDHAPLCVGKVGLVSGDGAAMLLSSSRRPHGESKLVRETPWNHGGRR